MADENIIHQKQFATIFEEDGKHYMLEASFKLTHLRGNRLPYFSITGELRRAYWVEKEQRFIAGGIISCGMLHNEIATRIPELRPFLPIHLADSHGTPMHALANAGYWLGLRDGYLVAVGERNNPYLASHLRAPLPVAESIPQTPQALGALVASLYPQWRQDAIDAITYLPE